MEHDHIPVLVAEIMAAFAPGDGDRLLDATIGLGGHAAAYLAASAPGGTVVGLDADPQALTVAHRRLARFGERVRLVAGNFSHLKDSLPGGGILPPLFNHILFDLGVGSHQLDDPARGFSFSSSRGLKMRYGADELLPPAQLASLNILAARIGRLPDVADVLAGLSAEELADVLRTYGEERYARRIARELAARPTVPDSAQALAAVVAAAVPAGYERGRLHPATRTFLGLRLAVNHELEALSAALPQALDLLAPGGKIAVISWHSLEDRIVKNFFRDQARLCTCPPTHAECTCRRQASLERITHRVVRPSEAEIAKNPRARSARLRMARKV